MLPRLAVGVISLFIASSLALVVPGGSDPSGKVAAPSSSAKPKGCAAKTRPFSSGLHPPFQSNPVDPVIRQSSLPFPSAAPASQVPTIPSGGPSPTGSSSVQKVSTSACVNSPDNRQCWGEFDINTDYYETTPKTGQRREVSTSTG